MRIWVSVVLAIDRVRAGAVPEEFAARGAFERKLIFLAAAVNLQVATQPGSAGVGERNVIR